jgi:uncharacterized protein
MGLVGRVHPITVAHPDRTKIVRFAISDQFLRFWFTFVHPYEDRLHSRADSHRHLEGRVLPRLDDFVSAPAFEQICQTWLRDHIGAAAVGWWWGNVREKTDSGLRNVHREVDAVALDHDGTVLALGSCKWTTGAMTYREKTLLRRLAGHLVPGEEGPDLYFFSRSGFDRKLTQESRDDPKCHCIEVGGLF